MLDAHTDKATHFHVAKLLLADNKAYSEFLRKDRDCVASLVVRYDVSLLLADKITPAVCQRLYEHREQLSHYLQQYPQDLAALLCNVNVMIEQVGDVVSRSVLQLSAVLSAYEREHRTTPIHPVDRSQGFWSQREERAQEQSTSVPTTLQRFHSWIA